jgi:hypothetical protein
VQPNRPNRQQTYCKDGGDEQSRQLRDESIGIHHNTLPSRDLYSSTFNTSHIELQPRPNHHSQTIFSTGMFNWQSTPSDPNPHVVSSYFWVYWAFTVPLTIMVAFSWRFWWAWEKRRLDRDVLLEIENIEDSASMDARQGRRSIEKEVGSSGRALGKAWQSLRRRKGKQASVEKDVPSGIITAKRQDYPPGSSHHVFGKNND